MQVKLTPMSHLITYNLIFLCLIFAGCKDNATLDKNDISEIQIVSCYSLEEVYNGFVIINDIAKSDLSLDTDISLIDKISKLRGSSFL